MPLSNLYSGCLHTSTFKSLLRMPAKAHRIPGYQNDPDFSGNATNNALAVLNSTVTLRTTIIPVIIPKFRLCAWPAQCYLHTGIVVACTRPQNTPAKAHREPHRQPTQYLKCGLHLICTEQSRKCLLDHGYLSSA